MEDHDNSHKKPKHHNRQLPIVHCTMPIANC